MLATLLCMCASFTPVQAEEMPWVQVAKDMKEFVLEPSGKPFTPWGFNYDHDADGRLIEDYWHDEWPTKDALDTLAGFSVGKPVVIEETFPLTCSPKELEEFIDGSMKHAAGWIGFYWGKTPDELRRSDTISDALTLGWLELFEKKAKALER